MSIRWSQGAFDALEKRAEESIEQLRERINRQSGRELRPMQCAACKEPMLSTGGGLCVSCEADAWRKPKEQA